jgi:hypothetical protein
MAKTNAERAAAFRSRRSGEKRKQINVWISEEFYLALKHLADECGLSLSEALERKCYKNEESN